MLNANAVVGNGGHIEVVADFVYQLWGSRITARSENRSAQPGTVAIRSGLDWAGSLLGLPGGLVTAGSEVREGCARRNPQANSLMVRGQGGLPPRPDSFLNFHDTNP